MINKYYINNLDYDDDYNDYDDNDGSEWID